MALADILKTFKTNQETSVDLSLSGELDRYILGKKSNKDLGRPYEERALGVHHPSALSSVACLRAHVYSWLDTPISNPQHSIKSDAIFGMGHDLGYRMQSYFWDMGLLLGEWKCINCGHEWLDMENPSPKTCPNCGVDLEILYNLHYLEVPLYNKAHNVMGRADGALKRPWGKQLIELKTIKNREPRTRESAVCFEDLHAPKHEHLLQWNLYTAMANELYGGFESGMLLYMAKNSHQRKEYVVRPLEELVNQMYVKADMVTSFLKQGILPERGDTEECRFCKWKGYCGTEHNFNEADNRKAE